MDQSLYEKVYSDQVDHINYLTDYCDQSETLLERLKDDLNIAHFNLATCEEGSEDYTIDDDLVTKLESECVIETETILGPKKSKGSKKSMGSKKPEISRITPTSTEDDPFTRYKSLVKLINMLECDLILYRRRMVEAEKDLEISKLAYEIYLRKTRQGNHPHFPPLK